MERARMNVSNFSIDEYKKLLTICRKHGVKFYMTLNTMFKDDELAEVVELFENKAFVLPDAIIAADMGLISMISKKISVCRYSYFNSIWSSFVARCSFFTGI